MNDQCATGSPCQLNEVGISVKQPRFVGSRPTPWNPCLRKEFYIPGFVNIRNLKINGLPELGKLHCEIMSGSTVPDY
jgi:hypothetical protein